MEREKINIVIKKYKLFLLITLSIGLFSFVPNSKNKSSYNKNSFINDIDHSILANRVDKNQTIISESEYFFKNQFEKSFPVDTPETKNTSINLEDPPNIKKEVIYDPITGKYVVSEKIGDLFYKYPTGMNLEEYLEYLQDKEMVQFLEEKIEEDNQDDKPSQLIPSINVKGKGFRNIFGSNQINIRPTGSVEISLGVNSSTFENPQIPQNQRNNTRFDFNQNIQVNLVGEVGTRLKLTTSYNSQANFDFQNVTKLEYTGDEDQIIKKIELGNVAMELPTSLIQGSQTLFGAKGKFQFGKTTLDLLASTHRGQKSEINIQGGAQEQEFEIKADNYEVNKHFFLNFFFRDTYDESMKTLPIVSSQVDITRVEVWVTNRQNKTIGTRNIVAFSDIGENKLTNCQGNPGAYNQSIDVPFNGSNGLYDWASNNQQIRNFTNATQTILNQTLQPGPFQQSSGFEKVQNARQLSENEFQINTKLGFISLFQPLNADEVLGVAYEFIYKGRTYQVGELSTDGIDANDALVVKLLKPTITSPKNKIWDLMMKNVYSIGAYNVGPQDFELNIWYNNPELSTLIRYLPYPNIDKTQLITLVGLDNINQQYQQFSDGFFDFVPMEYTGNRSSTGGTINTRNGRVFFPTIEPFGKTLKDAITTHQPPVPLSNNQVDAIVFQELYDSTKTAAQQIPSKNRFYLKGKYTSSVSSDISLNAFNIPEGSVVVMAGGTRLVEGVDYQVDYNLGRVKILNTGILESNTPIKISIESNSLFGFNRRTMLGARVNYRHNKDLNIGATWMNMTERPISQKVNFGDEPFSNHLVGFDLNYRANVPWLTKFVDWLPGLSTKTKSTFNFKGEFAHLIPGTPVVIGTRGTSFIDDFEGSQSTIDLKNAATWRLASVPKGQPELFPEGNLINDLSSGYNRSRLSWYTLDNVFWGGTVGNSLTPDMFNQNPELLEDLRSYIVDQTDIFPQFQAQQGQLTNIQSLDLSFYPSERGQYNYNTTGLNTDGTFTNPTLTWGGIMRSLNTTDFEQANVEFIQFWLMDPYNSDQQKEFPNSDGGKLYFNLGNVSEDVLPDSRQSFENGLPADGVLNGDQSNTNWSTVSDLQPINLAFDNNPNSRINQDVGYDGRSDTQERIEYADFINAITNSNLTPEAKARILSDPSSDNFNYYLDDDYDNSLANILERYKYFNGVDGNAPTTEMMDTMNEAGYNIIGRASPDIEDLNNDLNLSETEAYFQYEVSLNKSEFKVGQNYITSVVETEGPAGKKVKWYQFKIPVRQPTTAVNGINDYRSIRFMRIFARGLSNPVVLRFAKLELIRGEWRKYLEDLTEPGEGIGVDPNITTFNIATVNLEENADKQPVKYVLPPGVQREQDGTAANFRQLNEQSLSLEVCNLQDGDARAAYRNIGLDIRSYKKIKMYVHGEYQAQAEEVKDNEVTVFLRFGTDFTNNYYEYEMPVKITPHGSGVASGIWPEENNMDIDLEQFLEIKKKRNQLADNPNSVFSYNQRYSVPDPENNTRILTINGNPNIQDVKIMMIGVRNPSKNGLTTFDKNDDGSSKCVEIWVNELRLTDFDSKGGSAATAQMSVNLADWANVSMSGSYSGLNWGSIESRVSERQRDERFSFNLISQFQMGQFFGKKAGIRLPLHVSYSLGVIRPEYDPYNPDVRINDYDKAKLLSIQRIANDFTQRTSVNLTNVGKVRTGGKKSNFWDVENFSLDFAYSEQKHRDFNTEFDNVFIYRGGLHYVYNGKPFKWQPFKKVKKLNSPWLALIKDFHLNLGPNLLSIRNNLNRSYSERKLRNTLNSNFEFRPTYFKTFTWDRVYQFKYNITQNLKFDFSATNNSIFAEPDGQIDRKENPTNYAAFRDSIFRQLRTGGKTMRYNHTLNVSWNIPFNKIPITDWITSNVRYSAGYEWARAPLNQEELGHTIQNNRTFAINGQLNFTRLYNKISFFKKINRGGGGSSRRTVLSKNLKVNNQEKKDKKGKKKNTEKKKKTKKNNNGKIHPALGFLGRLIMTVRKATVSYVVTDGILLPGYNQETRILGFNQSFSAPSPGFVFGQQNRNIWGQETNRNIAVDAANAKLLVENALLNVQHTVTHSQSINGTITLEPFKDFRIDLSFNRVFSENKSEYFRWNDSLKRHESQSTIETSNLNFTTVSIATAFENFSKSIQSNAFDNLLKNRQNVSKIIGSKNPNSSLENGYYKGYGKTHQDVLIGAFLSAYTGTSSSNERNVNPFKSIPLPNWSLNYSGFTKYKFVRKFARSFSIKHSYTSSVNISGIQTNLKQSLDSDGHPTNFDLNGNYETRNIVQNIVISENFGPLLGFDATWIIKSKRKKSKGKLNKKKSRPRNNGLITKFEWRKDRTISLGLTNNQVTEVRGDEFVIGVGYKFPSVTLPFKIRGKKVSSDLNLRADVSIRDNITIVRKIDENSAQATAGQNVISIKSSLDYNLGRNLNFQIYYDQQINNPKLSIPYPSNNINAGIRLRINLGGL